MNASMAEHPKFHTPPVVETVLGLQFAPLRKFTAAHAGLYWRSVLGDDWSDVKQQPRLDDEIERLDEKGSWGQPGIALAAAPPLIRLQFTSRTAERMIQVQDSRFVYNWRRRGESYPTYEVLLPEFRTHFQRFEQFIADERLGKIHPNQWEVTYVNHILKGELWESPSDWEQIFPGVFGGIVNAAVGRVESMGASWSISVGAPDRKARLRALVQHARVSEPKAAEVIDLRLTARGPLESEPLKDVMAAFDVGHDSIVTTFDKLTSPAAQRHWGRYD